MPEKKCLVIFNLVYEKGGRRLTKEQLKRYRALKFELADVNAQIRQGSMQDSVQGSMKEHPYIMRNHKVVGVPDEDYDLLVRKSDLKAEIKEIEEFVNGIEDGEIRAIISLRYIRGTRSPSWQNIALKLGYRAEHTPKRKLQKYFEMSEMSENPCYNL